MLEAIFSGVDGFASMINRNGCYKHKKKYISHPECLIKVGEPGFIGLLPWHNIYLNKIC